MTNAFFLIPDSILLFLFRVLETILLSLFLPEALALRKTVEHMNFDGNKMENNGDFEPDSLRSL